MLLKGMSMVVSSETNAGFGVIGLNAGPDAAGLDAAGQAPGFDAAGCAAGFRKATLEDLDAIERIYSSIHDQEERGEVIIGWQREVYPTRTTAREAILAGDMYVELADPQDRADPAQQASLSGRGGLQEQGCPAGQDASPCESSARRVVASARINQVQVPEYALAAWKFDASPQEVLVLHTLTVDPHAGKHGYGTRFVAFYEQMARELGCPELRIDTNERNVRARALYARLGYDEVSIVPCVFNGISGVQLVCMEKRVDGPDGQKTLRR